MEVTSYIKKTICALSVNKIEAFYISEVSLPNHYGSGMVHSTTKDLNELSPPLTTTRPQHSVTSSTIIPKYFDSLTTSAVPLRITNLFFHLKVCLPCQLHDLSRPTSVRDFLLLYFFPYNRIGSKHFTPTIPPSPSLLASFLHGRTCARTHARAIKCQTVLLAS